MTESTNVPYDKPVPLVDSDGEEFWRRVREHRLSFQQCDECGRFRYPPRQFCPNCLSTAFTWQLSPTEGKVYSFVTFSHAYRAGYEAELPYNVSLIELENGVRMWANVAGDPETVSIGMPVKLDYDDRTSELTLPVFRPMASEQ